MAATTAATTRGGGGGGEGAKKREEEEEEKTKKRKISSLDSSLVVAAPTSSSKSTLRESLRALDASLRSKLDSISEKLVLTTTTTTTTSSDAAATTTTTSFKAPSSLTSAIGDAQEKQQLEERQKGEEKQKKGGGSSGKDKVKNKQDYLQDEMQPWVKPVGASLADPEQGPFIAWCEEHFREVTMADAKKLIPSTSQPRLEEDPDFCTLPEKERSYYEGARSILFFFFKLCFFSLLSCSLSNLFQIHLSRGGIARARLCAQGWIARVGKSLN
jgi:hypothetical protein